MVKTDDVGGLATKLRKAGLKVDAVPRTEKKAPTRWLSETWDSISRHPWWVASSGGSKSLVLVGNSSDKVEQGSAAFIRDVWSGLGDGPEHRLPVFRRMSLVALMSPETLTRFMEGTGSTTDLLVIHGGFLDADSLYQNFAYLAAVKSMFGGFLLYEAVVPDGVDGARLVDVARKSGFPLAVGVG